MNWSRCKGTLYLISDPTLPLLKFFTNARKDIESRLQSKSNLLRKQIILQGSTNKADKKENETNLFPNKLISLSKNIPSFRMTQDHPSSTTVLEKVINSNRPIVEKKGDLNHGRSKFSSEGSLGGLVAVLSRDPDVVWHLVHHVLQIATRHANHHLEGNHWSKGLRQEAWWSIFTQRTEWESWKEILNHLAIWIKGTCSEPRTDCVNLGFCSVHLPVATDKELSTHFVSVRPGAAIYTTTVTIVGIHTWYPYEGKIKTWQLFTNLLLKPNVWDPIRLLQLC